MPKLQLIATGGTIACLPSGDGLKPAYAARELLAHVQTDTSDIECVDLFALDSSNVQPEEWRVMARTVRDAVNAGAKGIILTHGTDTLGYTASMLSFMLRGVPVPVVLTGSQYPIAYPDSDGRKNLSNAIIAARALPGGVYIAFDDAVMLGCRAVKVRTTSRNAFESINAPYIGTIARGEYVALSQPPAQEEFRYCDVIEPNVALLKLVPGTLPSLFTALPGCGCRGLVVEAFGLGGVHSIRRDHTEAIRALLRAGMPVVICSQCLYEYSSTAVYEVSRPLVEAGVISARDMTTEAAVTKLMWALGQTNDPEEVRAYMNTSLCGEIGPMEGAVHPI